MSTQDRVQLQMSMPEVIFSLTEGNPGAVRVLCELLQGGNGIMDLLLCDTKRLYGSQIWVCYKDICGENIERFRYHLQVELPNQQTGQVSVTGPHAPPFGEEGALFWETRKNGAPDRFWALENPPSCNYRFPLMLDGSEPPVTLDEVSP